MFVGDFLDKFPHQLKAGNGPAFGSSELRLTAKEALFSATWPRQAMKRQLRRGGWLPFLNTYRTMCVAPEPEFRRVLEDARGFRFAA